MKSGTCPKCGCRNVYVGTDVVFKSGGFGSNTIPITMWSKASLDNYVCVDCGYVESYLPESYERERISTKWPRVQVE